MAPTSRPGWNNFSPEETPELFFLAAANVGGIHVNNTHRRQYGFHTSSVMPTNLYGPGDNFDLHVLPALIVKFHRAKARDDAELAVWGMAPSRGGSTAEARNFAAFRLGIINRIQGSACVNLPAFSQD